MNTIRISYPGGGRQHIKKAERDTLVLAGLIRKRADASNHYDWVGPTQSLHSMSELGKLSVSFNSQILRRFLPGSFIFEHEGKRYTELLETPEAMAMRMSQKGDKTCQDQQLE